MNSHKDARVTFSRRLQSVRDITERGPNPKSAAAVHWVSVPR